MTNTPWTYHGKNIRYRKTFTTDTDILYTFEVKKPVFLFIKSWTLVTVSSNITSGILACNLKLIQ